MSELPQGWVESPLMDVAEVYTGKKDANYADENGAYHFFTCAYEPLFSADYSFEGDVLILPGNGANVGEVFYYSGKFEAYQRTYVVDKIKIAPRFLYFHFLAFWRDKGVKEQFGTATNYIKIGNFKDYKVQFPSIGEQKRIVAKLDVLFGELEGLRSRLANIPELLKNFRQAVLTQAVTGKLTAQWREGNDIGDVEGILKFWRDERVRLQKEKILRKEKIIGDVLEEEHSIESLPEGWGWARWNDLLKLDNLSMKRGPFGSALKKDFFVDEGIRVFEQYNPINDDPHFERYYVTEEKYEELKAFTAQEFDLLISCSGTLGRITELPEGITKGIINQALLKLTLNYEVTINSYFIKLFRSPFMQTRIFDVAKGSAIPNMVGVNELKKMVIPLPPKKEQEEIVRRVENLFTQVTDIETKYKALKDYITELPQAILAKAFRGELVEQLSTDGNAKELLEEIKALKQQLALEKKKKKTVRKKRANS